MRHVISKLQVYNSKYSHPANQIIQLPGVSFVANSFWLMFRHTISLRQTFLEPKRFFYSGYQHVEFILEFLLKWSSQYFAIRTENYNKWHDTSRDWTFLEHFIFLIFFEEECKCRIRSHKYSTYSKLNKRNLPLLEQKERADFSFSTFGSWVSGNSFLGCMLFVEWQNLRDFREHSPNSALT